MIMEIKPRGIRYTQVFFRHDKDTLSLVKESYQREEDVTFSLNGAVCLSLSICARLCPESTDEEVDKLHCLNHSGSSATYSDYSPSQGSSGSSNPPANTHSHTHSHAHQHAPALPAPSKDQAPQTHWTNRYTHTHLLHVQFHHHPSLPTIRHLFFSFDCNPPSISSIYHPSHPSIQPLHAPSPPSIFLCLSRLSARSVKVRETH